MVATPHQLRHTCATLLLNAGAPILTVQMILGHRHIDTTLGYARLYDGTLARDYYAAIQAVEQSLADDVQSSQIDQVELNALIAMVDSLDAEALTGTQSDLVAALRDRLRLLAPSTDGTRTE